MKTVKSKLPFDYAKVKFLEFLNSNSMYDKYFHEFMWSYRSPNQKGTIEEYWEELAAQCSHYNWIDGFFVFHESLLGNDYWNLANLNWYRELDILNEEYAKSLECVD